MALWLKKEVAQYDQRRWEGKRVDMTYLTAQQREAHICHTWREAEVFIQRHLAKADAKGDSKYVLVVDTEEPPAQGGQQFSWHESELVRKGVKREEIEERWRKRESLKKGSDRKGADREEDRLDGIANATVGAFSIAAADDEEGRDTFAVHIFNLLGKNRVELPSSLLKLMSHRNVILVNVSQYDDIDAIVTTFYEDAQYRKEVLDIEFIEAQDLFLKAWGEDWNGLDKDGKTRSTNGLLNILEHANPGFTMQKHPTTINSDWLAPTWSTAQKKYVLEEVEFLSRAVRTVLKTEGPSFLDSLVCSFPLRKLGESAKKKGPYYGPSSTDSSRQTNPQGFSTTLSSPEDEQEAGAWFPASQLQQRRAEERKAAAAYTAASNEAAKLVEASTSKMTSPAAAPIKTEVEHRIPEMDVGVSAKERSTVTGEAVEKEEIKEEVVRASLPPFAAGFEKAIKRARPMAPAIQQVRVDWEVQTGPSPVLSTLVTDLNECSYVPSSSSPRPTPTPPRPLTPSRHSSPPPKRHRPDPNAEEIKLRSLSQQQQRQLNQLKRLLSKNLNARGSRMLVGSDKEVRPEMLGEILSGVHACQKNMDKIKKVMEFWEPQFSMDEKERFLKSVGKKASIFGMVTWFDLIRYDRFDVLMFVARNRHERRDIIRRNLCRISGNVDDALQQLMEWRNGGTLEILATLRTSRFISPALESALFPFVKPECFEEAAVVVCKYFWRPLPTPLLLSSFPSNMQRLVSASRQWELSEKTVVRLVKWMVREDDCLKEAAEVMLKEAAWAYLIWRKDEKYAATTLPCWEKRNSVHAEEFCLIRVDEINASLVTRRLRDEKGPVTVSYRLLNDPRFPKCLSTVMWQLPNSSEKFWMFVSRELGESGMGVMDALLGTDLVLVDLCRFSEAVQNCLHKTPKTERIAKGTLKGGRGHILQRLAKDRKINACLATSSRPIVDENDLDDCFIWHMAHELDLLVRRR